MATIDGQTPLLPRWLKPFALINGVLLVLGYSLHLSLLMALHVAWLPWYGAVETLLTFKNLLLLLGIDWATRHRPSIIISNSTISRSSNSNSSNVTRNYETNVPSIAPCPWRVLVASVTKFSVQEAMAYRLALYWGLVDVDMSATAATKAITTCTTTATTYLLDTLQWWLLFVVMSFVYEVVFDFGHYWAHRWLHEHPALYRAFHAAHHRHANPTVYHTFDDTVGGNVLTNCLPHLAALGVLVMSRGGRPLPHLSHALLLVYKTFVEVSGHSGKHVGNASSFPQCKALPSRLGIALYTQDHHTHHRNSKTNFSKRFTLWDRLFGTFHSAVDFR